MVPMHVAVQSIGPISSGNGHYDIHIVTPQSVSVSFGGQNDGSNANAQTLLQQLLIISPSLGSPLPLGFGITAHAYSRQALITWTEKNWTVQVSGPPRTPISLLKTSAEAIASQLHRVQLPHTTMGVLTWAHKHHGQNALDLSWQSGSTVYWVNEPYGHAIAVPIDMASSMHILNAP
ncbi:MAG: hypothetical protein OWR62_09305 [Sulfobacillus thermotolerans]|nr:hypothetical protein [Sulfobacillus thermotolerans]